jgi:VanZ family protein
MYAGLMSVIILENRKALMLIRNVFIIALIPLTYGILMEILQAALTVSRSGSVYDVFANSAGIIAAILLWILLKPIILKQSDSK